MEDDISGCSGCATESWGCVKKARTLHHPSGPWSVKMGHAAAALTQWSHSDYDTAGRCPFPLLSFFQGEVWALWRMYLQNTFFFAHCSEYIFLIQQQKCINQQLRWRENIHNSPQDGSALVYENTSYQVNTFLNFCPPLKYIALKIFNYKDTIDFSFPKMIFREVVLQSKKTYPEQPSWQDKLGFTQVIPIRLIKALFRLDQKEPVTNTMLAQPP